MKGPITVRRYNDRDCGNENMLPSDTGEWVRWDEVVAAMSAIRQQTQRDMDALFRHFEYPEEATDKN